MSTRRALALALAWLVVGGCADDAAAPPEPTAPPPDPAPKVCAGYAFSGAGARYFVVQPRLRPEIWTTYQSYRDHLYGLVEERVVPCLAEGRPNVVVFPENAGLHAAFLGSRGAEARTKTASLEAFVALFQAYAGPIAYNAAALGAVQLADAIVLGLTDTLWRAFDGTMRDIAARTGAYVIANADVAGEIEATSDPAAVSALADPDLPGATQVFRASDVTTFNTAYVYAPDGSIVAQRRKPYLVPNEEADLSLDYGRLEDVLPVDLGFAKLGIVTSKDAWMPDVIDRLDALGADVLVQPEAFTGWGIEQLPGDWLPAVVAQSGWAATQKHGGLRYAVIPHMTGHLLDLVFDGQSAIFTDATPGSARYAYVGLDPMDGVVAVAPWLADDPGVFDPTLPVDARRAFLREAAVLALPGGARENAYVETVIAADLDVAAPYPSTPAPAGGSGAPGALGASREVAPGSAAPQVGPRVAASGERVAVAWSERESGGSRTRVSVSSDGGATFGAPVAVGGGGTSELSPAVAVDGDLVAVAWQERGPAGNHVVVARSTNGGASFSVAESPTGRPAGADEWLPAIAWDGAGEVVVAFVSMESDNERVVVARSAGVAWSVVPADAAPPSEPPRNPRNNQWSPALAVRGADVAVAWTDFRAYQWDIYAALSTDGGATFGAAFRVDDAGEMPERIHDDARLAFDGYGTLWCGWSDVRLRAGAGRTRVAPVTGAAPSTSHALGFGPDAAPSWRPALAVAGSGALVTAWQDLRGGANDLYLAAADPSGASTWEARLDDGGDGAGQELRPDLAVTASGRVIAVWEDTRSGARRVRVAAGPLPAP